MGKLLSKEGEIEKNQMLASMTKQSNGTSKGPGVALKIREASGSSPSESVEVLERPLRRAFTGAYKLSILEQVEAAKGSGNPGAIGALLRKEGLFSSHLTEWRRARDQGQLRGLSGKKRGRKAAVKNPLQGENERLKRQVSRLEGELEKARTVIDVQKKVSSLLGILSLENQTGRG